MRARAGAERARASERAAQSRSLAHQGFGGFLIVLRGESLRNDSILFEKGIPASHSKNLSTSLSGFDLCEAAGWLPNLIPSWLMAAGPGQSRRL